MTSVWIAVADYGYAGISYPEQDSDQSVLSHPTREQAMEASRKHRPAYADAEVLEVRLPA